MKKLLIPATLTVVVAAAGWMFAQPAGDSLIEGFRLVEVASVADAVKRLETVFADSCYPGVTVPQLPPAEISVCR